MCHHQQSQFGFGKIFLQPSGHLQIEVVGGLVEDQQIGFGNKSVGQGDSFGLSSGEFVGMLIEIVDIQPGENLFDASLVVPGTKLIHAGHGLL